MALNHVVITLAVSSSSLSLILRSCSAFQVGLISVKYLYPRYDKYPNPTTVTPMQTETTLLCRISYNLFFERGLINIFLDFFLNLNFTPEKCNSLISVQSELLVRSELLIRLWNRNIQEMSNFQLK